MTISGVPNSLSASYTLRQVVRPRAQNNASHPATSFPESPHSQPEKLDRSTQPAAIKKPAIPEALNPMIEGVQQTAEQMGYVDVSPTAIYRAYANKQSLLVDVRA